jgi:hypothetical protein
MDYGVSLRMILEDVILSYVGIAITFVNSCSLFFWKWAKYNCICEWRARALSA